MLEGGLLGTTPLRHRSEQPSSGREESGTCSLGDLDWKADERPVGVVVHVWTDITSTTLVAAQLLEWYTRRQARRTKQSTYQDFWIGKQVLMTHRRGESEKRRHSF
jgi:hypothetical protein